MLKRIQAGIIAIALCAAQGPLPALAQSGPRYFILSANDVPRMNDNGGRLNLRVDNTRSVDLGGGQQIMLFRVGEVLPGSAFTDSGLLPGDEIFALNGYEFRDGESYAGYVHSLSGSRPVLDYVEHGTGRIMRIPALYAPPRSYAGRNSPTPPSNPSSDSSDNAAAIAGLVVIGAGVGLVCWLTSCLSGDGQSGTYAGGSSGGSSRTVPSYRFEPSKPSVEEPERAPVMPSVQGDVHGNLPSDIHGNPW